MPAATRAAAKRGPDAVTAGADAAERQDEDVCAICLSPVDAASEVKLACGHVFHGQCAVRALQLDRRCPCCRKKPSSHVEDDADLDEEADYERMLDESEDIVIGRLVKKVRPSNIRALLRDFGVTDEEATAADKQELAELLSEQLHYETDDAGEEDEGEEDDDDNDE